MNYSEQYVLYLYTLTINYSKDILFSTFPELNDPSNELQYQLLKLEYGLLEFTNSITESFENLNRALQEQFQMMADEFIEFGDWDDVFTRPEYKPKHRNVVINNLYKYIRDIRTELRAILVGWSLYIYNYKVKRRNTY